MGEQFYIQYHNCDSLACYPTDNTDFLVDVEKLSLDDSIRNEAWIFTKKKLVENAIGHSCFLIAGKTEQRVKRYFLWAYFKIEGYKLNKNKYYSVIGTGFDFQRPIYLNDLGSFKEFKNYCGNFGIGFQNVTNHPFCERLRSFINVEIESFMAMPTEEAFAPEKYYSEGKLEKVFVNRFERNREAREKCIEHYGDSCAACGFNFGKFYGDKAKGFIHVHHRKRISEIGQEYQVSPKEDLIPLCANCHSVVHLSDPMMSIEELKNEIEKSKLDQRG